MYPLSNLNTISQHRDAVNNIYLHIRDYLVVHGLLGQDQDLADEGGDPITRKDIAFTAKNILANVSMSLESARELAGQLDAAISVLKKQLDPDLAMMEFPSQIVACAASIAKSAATMDVFAEEGAVEALARKTDIINAVAEISGYQRAMADVVLDLENAGASVEARRFTGVSQQWEKSVDAAIVFTRKKHRGEIYRVPQALYAG